MQQTGQVSAPYNRFSGQSLDRVTALSDGVFAVAMTLLVLDLRVPVDVARTEPDLADALARLAPSGAAYLLSFTMLGTFWLAQHTLLGLCTRMDRTLTWWELAFLFVVTLLPFTASILAEFLTVRVAVGLYWLNLLLLGLTLAGGSRHIARRALVDTADRDKLKIFRRRIVVAQAAYGVAALACLVDTYVSVGALALVQLYFIVSPRIPGLDRLLQPGS